MPSKVNNMCILKLNFGITNRHNFFDCAIFLFQKSGTDSVNRADSSDSKLLVLFPGNSNLRFLSNFGNCVGGTHVHGCFILKITDYVDLITAVNLIYKIWYLFTFVLTHAILSPVIFDFRSVFMKNHICPT